MSLQKIKESLDVAYSQIIVPVGVRGLPIELEKTREEDAEGKLLDTYYSLDNLTMLLPNKFFELTPIIDDRFVMFRWSIPHNKSEENTIIGYLEANGLVDMVPVGAVVKDIDFTTLADNSFGIFSAEDIKYVPKLEVEEV